MKNLHRFAACFNLALLGWGAFLLANGVKFGGALIAYGVICGASAMSALKGRK